MSGRQGWSLLVAVTACALLGAYLLLGGRPAPVAQPEIAWRVETRTLSPEDLRHWAGAAHASPNPPAAPSDLPTGTGADAAAARPLTVRVVAAEDSRALEGASVWWLDETERSQVEGWSCLAEVREGPLATGPDGRVSVAWGAPPAGRRRAVASAPGFGSAEVGLALDGANEVTLRLPRGLTLAGQVADAEGQPQRGLKVSARSASRPRAADVKRPAHGGEVPDPRAEWKVAVSDDSGHFTFEGLGVGTYWLTCDEPGWVVRGMAPPATADPLPGVRGVVARAGDRDARLVVSRVGLVALSLVDAASGADLVAVWTTVSVKPLGRGQPTVVTSYAGRAVSIPVADGPPLVLDPTAQPAGRVVAALAWSASDSEVEVEVRAAGYAAARARAPIQSVPAGGSGGLTALPTTRVELTREGAAGPCRLVLDLARETGLVARPATRILTLCHPADGARVHAAGRRLEGERWAFDALPAGEGVAEVWDGLSFSKPLDVVLADGVPLEARATFGPLAGALFVLRDATGRRVYDAEALLIAPKGRERGLPDRADATRLRASGESLVPLEPGEYRFGVSKPGLGYAGGAFVVRPDEVVRVEATLALPTASDATGPGRPR